MKNEQGKMRKVNEPYEVWRGVMRIGGDVLHMEWRVLKKWQADDNKEYARWFCAVKSEATFGGYDMGDVYVSEIKQLGTKVEDISELETW